MCLQLFLPSSPSVAWTCPKCRRSQDRNVCSSGTTWLATLLVGKAELTAGELPQLTLVLTNRAKGRLRVPNAEVDLTTSVRVFDSDGEEILPRQIAIIDRWVFPTLRNRC